jgi:hypothetical protein
MHLKAYLYSRLKSIIARFVLSPYHMRIPFCTKHLSLVVISTTTMPATKESQHGHTNPPCVLLRTSGAQIVDPQGTPVVLKGAGLGGMLNMENFITG